jgi:hypothetical protein
LKSSASAIDAKHATNITKAGALILSDANF